MNPFTLLQKSGISIVVIGLLLFGVKLYGAGQYSNGQEEAQNRWDSAILVANTIAKATIVQQEADNVRIKMDADKRVAGITAYYERLRKRDNRVPADSTAISYPCDDDGAERAIFARSDQCRTTITGCPVEVEEKFAMDANTINTWRQWCTEHNCPVSKE